MLGPTPGEQSRDLKEEIEVRILAENQRDAAREAREKVEKDAKELAQKYGDLLARFGASEDQPPASAT